MNAPGETPLVGDVPRRTKRGKLRLALCLLGCAALASFALPGLPVLGGGWQPWGGKSEAMPLSGLDLTMLKNDAFPPAMETPPSLLVINAALVLDKLPPREEIVESFRQSFGHYVRFRSTLHADGSVREVPDFDPSEHIVSYAVSGGPEPESGRAGLATVMEHLAAQDLDPTRPLWRVYIVDRKHAPFLVLRVHHAVCDGFHLAMAFPRMVTTSPTGGEVGSFFNLKGGQKPKDEGVVGKLAVGLGRVLSTFPSFVSVASLPHRRFETENTFSPVAPKRAGNVYSGKRKVVFLPDLSLDFVKALKTAANATLNDVLMGAFAGAVRRYSLEQEATFSGGAPFMGGRGVPGLAGSKNPRMRALVPFGFPPTRDEPDALENDFAFLSAPLPVGEATSTERVAAVNEAMNGLKNSMKAPVALWLVKQLQPKMPTSQGHQLSKSVFQRHSVVYSNLPGPAEPLFFKGSRVLDVQLVVNNVLPQVLVFSYAGRVTATMTVDPAQFDAELFSRAYETEFRQLAEELGVPDGGKTPWGRAFLAAP